MSPEYRFPIPASALREMLQHTPKPFSESAATASVMLDLDVTGKAKAVRAYSRIWGWSRKRVSTRLPALIQDAANWRQFPTKGGSHLGASKGPKNGAKSNKIDKTEPLGSHLGATTNTDTDTDNVRPPIIPRSKSSRRESDLDALALDSVDYAWAAEKTPNADPDETLDRLRDYCASSGKSYKDYRAAWRTFCRTEHKRAQSAPKRYDPNQMTVADLPRSNTTAPVFNEAQMRLLSLPPATGHGK